MAIPTGIDSNTPVIARHQIDINAPLGLVWRLHTNVNNWPAWQTDITAARRDGPFEPGDSFTWTSNGFTVTSTIYAVAEGARTLWGAPPKASPEPTNGWAGLWNGDLPQAEHVSQQGPSRRTAHRAGAAAGKAAAPRTRHRQPRSSAAALSAR